MSRGNVFRCPVCGGTAPLAFVHPEAHIHQCIVCTHVFSELDSLVAVETYDDRYFNETHRRWFERPNIALFRWIAKRIPAHTRSAIDIGCGRGDFLRYLRAARRDLRLVGLDLGGIPKDEGIEYLRGDFLTMPIAERFECVVALAVIEHVRDVAEFARRLRDVCDKDGRVFVMTLNNNSLLYIAARLAHQCGMSLAFERLYGAHHLHHFTPESLCRLLERSGLVVEEIHQHNAPLSAIDIPVKKWAARNVVLSGVAALFLLGSVFRRCYLQTVVARRI